jgi:hypothetical protein
MDDGFYEVDSDDVQLLNELRSDCYGRLRATVYSAFHEEVGFVLFLRMTLDPSLPAREGESRWMTEKSRELTCWMAENAPRIIAEEARRARQGRPPLQ